MHKKRQIYHKSMQAILLSVTRLSYFIVNFFKTINHFLIVNFFVYRAKDRHSQNLQVQKVFL